jgi:sec-independent protein translocase protein TatA
MGPSIWHILVVVLVVVLLFGTSRLPRVMEDLAKGMQAFKKGLKDDDAKAIESKRAADKAKEPE